METIIPFFVELGQACVVLFGVYVVGYTMQKLFSKGD